MQTRNAFSWLKKQITRSISVSLMIYILTRASISSAYPIFAQQGYENPREATGRIVCANCHLANKPVEIEVPQAVLPDTVFEAVVRIPYDMQLKQVKMSNSAHARENNGIGLQGGNGANVGVPPQNPGVAPADVGVPPQNPGEAPVKIPVDVNSRNVVHVDVSSHTNESVRGEEREVSLQIIFEMLQAQQVAIAELQSHHKTPSIVAPETAPRVEQTPERPSNNGLLTKEQRFMERESRPNKERYRPYVEDRRNAPKRNVPRVDRRSDRGQVSRGLMSKAGFDRHTGPAEAPRLSEYNFSVDVSGIVSAMNRIKDTRWPETHTA
ncbi:PREDICTED: uncharacterized protein LOC109226242 [Nicotiana attenuata]|uniref:uncharacterized protein LOC109226242 n=1 Tax=Nicotiana attenuata TaxID=49451 RepID=UPI0009057967|nr:PREDICTED: uncharacterized protein LOC109226242 [Nicotiana attenuata]